MAGKNLYEILEVARNATPEVVSAAYRLQCERLNGRALKDSDGAAALRLAVDEAYNTLSNPQMRSRYDLRLRQPIPVDPQISVDESSWFVRNWAWLSILVIVIAGAGYFHDKSRKERVAAERKLAEQQLILERERAEQAAAEAARQAAAAEIKAKQDRDKESAWSEQVRARARVDAIRRGQLEDRNRQLEERQQETERLRQENEARRNLEREKAKLRALECARGPC